MKKHGFRCTFAVAAAVSAALCIAGTASAALIELREGITNAYVTNYAGTADNTISQANATWAASNAGGDPSIHVSDHSSRRRGMLYFDLSALSGQVAAVNSASLVLTKSVALNTSAWTQTENFIQAFQITPANAGWAEGSKPYNPANVSSAAGNGESSWALKVNNSDPALQVAWAAPDWLSTTSATRAIEPAFYAGTVDHAAAAGTAYTIANTALTDLARLWIETPTDNAGILLNVGTGYIGTTRQSSAFQFASSENSNENWRPTLILDVTLVPEPASMAVLALAPLGLLRRSRRA